MSAAPILTDPLGPRASQWLDAWLEAGCCTTANFTRGTVTIPRDAAELNPQAASLLTSMSGTVGLRARVERMLAARRLGNMPIFDPQAWIDRWYAAGGFTVLRDGELLGGRAASRSDDETHRLNTLHGQLLTNHRHYRAVVDHLARSTPAVMEA